jgi:penicillin-binding protein 1C
MLFALALAFVALPPPLERIDAPGSVLVTAHDGTPLRAFADEYGVWRFTVRIDQVSPAYIDTLLVYEDRWFYRHPGVNPLALLRAAGQALLSGGVVSGGSTLTMQVARLIEPIPRTPLGKLKQCWRALQLEARFSKRELIEIYLNLAPFGGTIEGVQAASYAYLGKSAHQLSDAEAALLVVLPQAPSRLRPDRHPHRAQLARDKVIARMVAFRAWRAERAADARIEQVVARRLKAPMLAPLLAERLRGAGQTLIRSTLDARLQARVEDLVAQHLRRLPERNSIAAIVVDSATMATLAYVGSANLNDADRAGHVDMVRAARSPGSTLKPMLYGMALDAGLIHSASLLIDAPQSFQGYQPSNFMERYQGPVSAAQALRLSLNVPAVDLLDRLGVVRFTNALENAGLRMRLGPDAEPNLALILGGGATSLEELIGAYAAFARGGLAARPRLRADEPLRERFLLSPGAAWITRRMLERDPSDSYSAAVYDGASRVALAWKTGTSYGFRDSWAIGVAPQHLIGVWIGRPDGTPQPGQFGAITALPLLAGIADGLPSPRSDPTPAPSPVRNTRICWPLGGEHDATDAAHCHRALDAWVLDAVPPTLPERGIDHWQPPLMQIWRDGRYRRNASCPAAAAQLETVARWPALAHPWLSSELRERASLPPLHPDCAPDELSQGLRIGGISDGMVLRNPSNRRGAIRIETQALGSRSEVRWLINDRYAGSSTGIESMQLRFDADGDYRVVAIDGAGAWAAVSLRVIGVDG